MFALLVNQIRSVLRRLTSRKQCKQQTTRSSTVSSCSSSPSSLSSPSAALFTASRHSWLACTPPALLALICQHLQVTDILRLLRCCSNLRLLNDNGAFADGAWSALRLELRLNTELHEWALPCSSCIHDPSTQLYDRYIPLSLWQQALPVLEYTQQQWDIHEHWLQARLAMEQLRAAVVTQQPTTTIVINGEQHVVLSSVTWSALFGWIDKGAPNFRGLFVLTATPHLQHLSILMNVHKTSMAPLSHIFPLVPRLRSLRMEKDSIFDFSTEAAIPTRAILDALPQLTALSLLGFRGTAQELIDIAAHATLEHIHINAYSQYVDEDGLRGCFMFHTDGEEEGAAVMEQGQQQMTTGSGSVEMAAARDDAMARLSLALVRVVCPSQRSVRARLTVAAFLHCEIVLPLELSEDSPGHVTQPSRSVVQQLAMLQLTLRDQLAS